MLTLDWLLWFWRVGFWGKKSILKVCMATILLCIGLFTHHLIELNRNLIWLGLKHNLSNRYSIYTSAFIQCYQQDYWRIIKMYVNVATVSRTCETLYAKWKTALSRLTLKIWPMRSLGSSLRLLSVIIPSTLFMWGNSSSSEWRTSIMKPQNYGMPMG